MTQSANPGDIVARDKMIGTHYGVVLHDGFVLHNTWQRGEHVSSMQSFANGREVRVQRQRPEVQERVLFNASAIIRHPRSYNFFSNNCEHTVTRCLTGKGHSPALGVLSVAALLVGAVVLWRRG